MKIHLLDVGQKEYGDCILILADGRRILIDGAHPGDDEGDGRFPSIPEQLEDLLGSDPPFDLDLLVVTHCHGDHIGCLPELVSRDLIRPKAALVADLNLGYGIERDGSDSFRGFDAPTRNMLAALREEPLGPDASDARIAQFISDAAGEETRYRRMLQQLEARGCAIVSYVGPNDATRDIERAFSALGLRILGPSAEQLLMCTNAVVQSLTDAATLIETAGTRDASPVDLYRHLATERASLDADDPFAALDGGRRPGNAINNQSIVISVAGPTHRALLTGDMQFARPDTDGLAPFMKELLDTVEAAGPYGFIKLPHHAAANGFNSRVARRFPATRAFAMSTGRSGVHHPNPRVLELLDENRDDWTWARTDINGLITVDLAGAELELDPSAGELNDATPKQHDEAIAAFVPPVEPPQAPPVPPAEPQVTRAPGGGDVVIMAAIPSHLAQVKITVDIQQGSGGVIDAGAIGSQQATTGARPLDWSGARLAGGRQVPKLAFVTDRGRLAAKIGGDAVGRIEEFLKRHGHAVIAPHDLAGRRQGAGVVILGGYDVVPAERYNVIPNALRAQVRPGDPDDFVVWSDQRYGDTDGDGLSNLPVSRIPDGGSESYIARCLGTGAQPALNRRFCIKNLARPFADAVFNEIPGAGPVLHSGTYVAKAQLVNELAGANVYFMLHGSESDCTKFWGEDANGGALEAFNLANAPDMNGAIVLSGCCWGALTVDKPANRSASADHAAALPPARSIALTLLERGARCFVGCTGAHYSPLTGDLNYFGRPIHSAFWTSVGRGAAPAQALFDAKKTYIDDMPHGRTGPEDIAIEYKILRQFTCLGLGW